MGSVMACGCLCDAQCYYIATSHLLLETENQVRWPIADTGSGGPAAVAASPTRKRNRIDSRSMSLAFHNNNINKMKMLLAFFFSFLFLFLFSVENVADCVRRGNSGWTIQFAYFNRHRTDHHEPIN